jgi:methylmalonyl-CoA mutase N-terminal domain/subunit
LQREIDSGRRVVVGVNAFTESDDSHTALHRVDPALEQKQVDRVRAAKAGRDSDALQTTLADVKAAAGSARNLMPLLIDAARLHASEGELVLALQEVWGDYREQPVF